MPLDGFTPTVLLRFLILGLLFKAASSTIIEVNYGYFKEPAGHMWTYGADAHSWTDPTTGHTFKFRYWPQTSGVKVIKKLQTGELDISHCGNYPWAMGTTRGIPGKMIYVIHSKDRSQVLVARADIIKPSDLKGKRVAYIRGSTTHYMLQLLFQEIALEPKDLKFYGHMDAGPQKAAWDAGEIDAGFMWSGNMRYLQENPWCTKPKTGTNCSLQAKGKVGRNLYTAGMSKRWGRETWNNLVVRSAFAAKHPRAVSRIVKVISMMDSKLVTDKGFFSQNSTRACRISSEPFKGIIKAILAQT